MISKDVGNKKIILKFERLGNEIFYEVEKAYHEIGKLLTKDLKQGLKRGARGGTVFKYKNRMLKASTAGEYPQRRTGNLRSSVKHRVFSYKEMWFGILDKAEYAVYLEDKGRLLVDHTVDKLKADQQNILRKRLNTAIKR